MNSNSATPKAHYGVLAQDKPANELEEIAEQVRRLGYAVLDSGISTAEITHLSDVFDRTHQSYLERWGETRLRETNEQNTIRALIAQGAPEYIQVALNPRLLAVVDQLIPGKFVLNQQNGVINPAGADYNQGAWHRDLPYQHFTSSSPLAVNALFCIDDFTFENGSTFVLPTSHKAVNFPSESYIQRNALQVEARAGQYILLDCMVFHSGGFNATSKERRAINQVYTIPYIRQQISIPAVLAGITLTKEQREICGFGCQDMLSVEQYLSRKSSS